MLRSAHRQRQYGHGRILPATGNETRTVNDYQILDVMALAPLVQDAGLWVIPHTRGTHFMNAVPGRIELVGLRDDFPASRPEQLFHRVS